MIKKLAFFAVKNPWWMIALWAVIIFLAVFLTARFLSSALTTDQTITSNPESHQAKELLQDRLGTDEKYIEIVIVKSDSLEVADPEFRTFSMNLEKKIQDLGKDKVESTVSFYESGNPAFVSKKQNGILILAKMNGDLEKAQKNVGELEKIVKEADRDGKFSVVNSGTASINNDFQDLAEKDLQKAETFGIPVALVVLIIVFGALGAAILPIALSGLAILLALGLSALLGQVYPLSFFITNMITMMGLAVGIDYVLFFVSRFREERASGIEKAAAILTSANTAGRAIFFSGLTVIFALLGLLIVPVNVFRSLSIGAIFVVGAAIFSSLTLLPALLSLLGDKVNFLSIPFISSVSSPQLKGKGFWGSFVKIVTKYPIISVEIAAGILILASIPLLSIKIGSADVSSLPKELPSKKGFTILKEDFSSGLLSPTRIVIDADPNSEEVRNSIATLSEKLKSEPTIPGVQIQSKPEANISVIDVPISADGDKATTLIRRIRQEYVPQAFSGTSAKVFVGGEAASNLDFIELVSRYTPIVFAFVLGLSFLLLMMVFRSLVIPLKAIVMNLLSVATAYGLMVLVTQRGVGREFFGFEQVPVIEAWIPLFLFAILFGLSMDYHVFLLSRIKERFDETGDNTESVAFGIASTGRIITGAALIMVVVFAAFAAGSLTMFQQFGFGLAVAIFLDATIIRTVLVPSTMELLGDANWFFPKWLEWLPNLNIDKKEDR